MRYYLGYRFIYSTGRKFKMIILLREGMGRCWYGQVIWEIRTPLGIATQIDDRGERAWQSSSF